MTAQNNGRTPMHYACRSGSVEMVKLLLRHLPTFDSTSRNDLGQTIFRLATVNPDPQVLKLILKTFSFEDIRDDSSWTMIHAAVANGPKDTIQFLLESRPRIGFNLEARDVNDDTILHLACQRRDIQIVDLVYKALEEINSDINFDTQQIDQGTPLHSACRNPKSDVAVQLLQRFPQKIHVLALPLYIMHV